MFKVFGVILIVLAIVTAVVPMFTDCQSQGNTLALIVEMFWFTDPTSVIDAEALQLKVSGLLSRS